MAQLLLTSYIAGARLNRAKRSRSMKPIVCAVCREALTSALWDKDTEQLYCRRCVPPLPPQLRPPTAGSKIPVSDLNFPASSK
jgi:hypothetical protein